MGSYKKALAKARANVMASRQLARESRVGGFQSTTDLIGGIYGNASSGISKLGAGMTMQNARQLRALAAVADRTHAGNSRDVRGGARTAQNLFGAASQLAAPEFARAAGHSRAADIALAGAARAGVATAKGANTVLGILQSGVAEAQAGAVAQTADALKYRAKNDAQMIADQQAKIMQSQLDFANWKRQQEYLKKQAAKDANAQGVDIVERAATTGAVTMRQYLVTHPDATVNDLVTEVTRGDTTLAQDPNANAVLSELARQVKASVDSSGQTIADYSRADEANDIFNSIIAMYPNYKDVTGLKATIKAGLDAGWSAAVVSADAADTAIGAGNNYQVGPGRIANTGLAPDFYGAGQAGATAQAQAESNARQGSFPLG